MNLRTGFGIALLVAVTIAAGGWGPNGKVKKTTVNGVAWFNSLSDAQAEAKRTGKPILFFSMFGKIDEDMPCANARTLRATLFKDPEFKKLLTEEVIPAWEMVRAVPKVEIDLGDGKKIKRTVRGNAVMYVCNSEGKVIDAYPGVYTAGHFLPAVRESLKLANADWATVKQFHQDNGRDVEMTPTTLGKMAVEAPTLDFIGARAINGARSKETTTDPARARFLRSARNLIDASLRPMNAREAASFVTGEELDEKAKEQMAQKIMQRDSETNMNRMRPVIHLWLASEKDFPTPAQARDTVLETILKIPYKDPYFGLKDILLPGTPG